MRLRWLVWVTLFLCMASGAIAEEEIGWNGNLGLAYLQTDGNTESQTLSLDAKVQRSFSQAKLTAEGKGLYGKKEGETTEKSWIASLKYDQNVTDRTYLYALETVDRNTLKGIEFRFNHQGGLGHYFIKTEKDTLKVEIGAGYVSEHQIIVDPLDPLMKIKDENGYPSARAFGEYSHVFTETTRFEQTVEFLPNLKETEDYMINEESALITNLFGQFALKVSFSVTFDHLPPEGFKKSDRLFKTALLYTF